MAALSGAAIRLFKGGFVHFVLLERQSIKFFVVRGECKNLISNLVASLELLRVLGLEDRKIFEPDTGNS
jgi:hypothetical protein